MKAKHLQLIRCLNEQNDWMNASALAARLNVSLRSVKNYVADISVMEPHLILSSRQGYRVNKQKVHEVFSAIDSGIPQTPDERVNYIIHKLIKEAHDSNHEQLNIYDLSDDICVSAATLKADIQKVKRRCDKYDLTFVSSGDFISLQGLEKNKRRILSSIMYHETKENFMNLTTVQNAFIDYDIAYIQVMIANTLKKHHYFINDYSLMNLVLHVTIVIDRITNHNICSGTASDYVKIKNHEYELALEIVRNLEKHYQINYNENEIYELSLLLISSATNLDYNTVNALDLEKTVGTEIARLSKNLIANMNAYYYLDLNEPEFITRFTLHIKNLIVRADNQHFSRNPLTKSIKSSCPFIYECAVAICDDLREQTGYIINDDEIAYIAFHIGGALENQKNLDNKVTCIVLFPQYYDMNLKMTEKLNTEFQDRILVKYVITKEHDLEGKRADLIISTIQLSAYTDIPALIVSPFINDNDRNAIFYKLDEVTKAKKNKIFKHHLQTIFHPDFFEKNPDYHDEKQVIPHICSVMRQHAYVDDEFVREVFEHEAMSSTVFHNIAIPHSMKMRAHKTGMYVILHDKGIHWDKNTVNIILLLSINKNERKVFREMFDSLTTILINDVNVRKVMQSNTYQEFIDNIVNSN